VLFARVNTHAAPAVPSSGPPISAVLPSADSATLKPCAEVLDERIDSQRVARAAVIDVDRQPASADPQPRAQ